MPEFLARAVEPVSDSALSVLVRLLIAMVLGGAVTVIYRVTRAADEAAPSFTVTLVLLSILIAMVTQVIGDNVARAFSLVGALSGRHENYMLKVRLGLGHDAGQVLGPTFDSYLLARHLVSIETAKQGMALELSYRAALRSEAAAGELVKALNRLEGVQGISLERMDSRDE